MFNLWIFAEFCIAFKCHISVVQRRVTFAHISYVNGKRPAFKPDLESCHGKCLMTAIIYIRIQFYFSLRFPVRLRGLTWGHSLGRRMQRINFIQFLSFREMYKHITRMRCNSSNHCCCMYLAAGSRKRRSCRNRSDGSHAPPPHLKNWPACAPLRFRWPRLCFVNV